MKINEITNIKEGADFSGYTKKDNNYHITDNLQTTTPHRSNFAAREVLSRLGRETDFENTMPITIDDFITTSMNWLNKNVADKDTQAYDEIEMYNIEANKFKKQGSTHVGFN